MHRICLPSALQVQCRCMQSVKVTVSAAVLVLMQIYGIRYGLRGFYSRDAKPMELNARAVEGIHLQGGTVLVGTCTSIPESVSPKAFVRAAMYQYAHS